MIAVLLAGALLLAQAQAKPQTVTGMVVEVKPSERVLVVSHDPVPGVMPAMIMPFEVSKATDLNGVAPGAIVTFTLRSTSNAAYADDLRIIRYESGEQDPLTVRRLRLLRTRR